MIPFSPIGSGPLGDPARPGLPVNPGLPGNPVAPCDPGNQEIYIERSLPGPPKIKHRVVLQIDMQIRSTINMMATSNTYLFNTYISH